MKGLLVVGVLAIAGYLVWQKFGGGGAPQVIENPVYGEVRVTAVAGNRDLEMALFIRASSDADCHGRATLSWGKVFENCPTCELASPVCKDELPPRYARLFDDAPIPSAYLSATAGNSGERDGRLVVYGLTDQEGAAVCELMRKEILKTYSGTAYCVAPSGG